MCASKTIDARERTSQEHRVASRDTETAMRRHAFTYIELKFAVQFTRSRIVRIEHTWRIGLPLFVVIRGTLNILDGDNVTHVACVSFFF